MAVVDEGALSVDYNTPTLPDTTPVAASVYGRITAAAPALTSITLSLMFEVFLLFHSALNVSYCVKLA